MNRPLGLALTPLLLAVACGSGDSRPAYVGPPSTSPTGTPTASPTGTATSPKPERCVDGEQQVCAYNLPSIAGSHECVAGTRICVDGTWGPCVTTNILIPLILRDAGPDSGSP